MNNTRLDDFLHCKLMEFDPSTLHPFLPFTIIICSSSPSPVLPLLLLNDHYHHADSNAGQSKHADQGFQERIGTWFGMHEDFYTMESSSLLYKRGREKERKGERKRGREKEKEREIVGLWRDDNVTNDSKGSFKRTNNDLLSKCILLQILFANHVCPFQGLNE